MTYTVQRPVTETVMRQQCHTVMQPVVTQQTQMVDQGCYREQVTYKPSWWANRLAWQGGGTTVDPVTGAAVYHAPGFYWVPTNRGTYEVNRVWQPNVVAQQVQQVQYVPQTVTEQVPVQMTSFRTEQVVQKVPYQTCRIVQHEEVRKVPYTVSRPVTEHVDRKVPIQVTRMVTEEQVRRVPYQTCRMVQEERVEQVPTQVCRMESYEETVRIPRVVEKRIPVTYNYTVPRVECFRVPVDDCCSTGCDVPAAAPASSCCGVPAGSGGVVTVPGVPASGGVMTVPGGTSSGSARAGSVQFEFQDSQPAQWRKQAHVELGRRDQQFGYGADCMGRAPITAGLRAFRVWEIACSRWCRRHRDRRTEHLAGRP